MSRLGGILDQESNPLSQNILRRTVKQLHQHNMWVRSRIITTSDRLPRTSESQPITRTPSLNTPIEPCYLVPLRLLPGPLPPLETNLLTSPIDDTADLTPSHLSHFVAHFANMH